LTTRRLACCRLISRVRPSLVHGRLDAPSIEDTDDLFMRRRLLTFLLAALAAISMAVPLWAALRSERNLIVDRNGQMQVHHTTRAPRPAAEAATLVFTGIMLLGLASAVRRAS
jgi:hypothetical protein